MGFMDKAKQLAEQAQEKLDDVQKQVNERQGGQAEPTGEGPRYDKHGRPEAESAGAPPAASTPPPAAEPAESTAEPSAPPPAEKPREGGSADATPDPFKPIE